VPIGSSVTDKQRAALLSRARKHLRQTTRGYNETGSEWKAAIKLLDELEADLAPKTNVPALGPVLRGGSSILEEDLTHDTGGIPDYPAFDAGFGDVGRDVIAPEALEITDDTSGSQGGDAFYARGKSGIEYWFGHITHVPKQGTKFRKGQKMTEIAPRELPHHRTPHLHLAVDARPLIGHVLLHKIGYQHGAPTIGAQLKKALA
jgi:hypothetical protein